MCGSGAKVSLLNAPSAGLGRLDDATDLDELPMPELEAHLCSHAALVAAETAAFLRVLAAFDRRGGWRVDGVR